MRAAGGSPAPRRTRPHAQLSGEDGSETPALASAAPEVVGLFPLPLRLSVCLGRDGTSFQGLEACNPGLILCTPPLSGGIYPAAVATTCWVKAWPWRFPVIAG